MNKRVTKTSILFLIFSLFINACHSINQEPVKGEKVSDNRIGIPAREVSIRDPFVVVDGASKTYFTYANGGKKVIAYKSKDLEYWTKLDEPVFLPDEDFWGTKDFWAPDVYLYNDKYYMFITVSSETEHRGTTILVADKPEGPFAPLTNRPITPEGKTCLDGSLFIDDEGTPWMLYCYEWIEIVDGEIYAQQLSPDLKEAVGEPIKLFKASDAPWTGTITSKATGVTGYVTDAPFLYKTDDGQLLMLWSSFTKKGQYAIGQAISKSGEIAGPWEHDIIPLNTDRGGHAMLFTDLDGNLKISYHSPNNAGKLTIYDAYVEEGNLKIKFR